MESEKEFVKNQFVENFKQMKLIPIALYGVGESTKEILETHLDFNISCLLDELTVGQAIYGKPVVPLSELVALGIRTIVIIARSQSTSIIYKRIKDFCSNNAINVYDINGVLLSESTESKFDENLSDCIQKLYRYANGKTIIDSFVTKIEDGLIDDNTGKIQIKSNYNIAYLFIAPFAYKFFAWITAQSKEHGLDEVLLSSRDGYLFFNIYTLLKNKYELPKMRYFYISRVAAISASIYDEEDILRVSKIPFYDSAEIMLAYRFRLNQNEIRKRNGELDEEYILKHKAAILEHSAYARNQYLNYIKQLGIGPKAKIGFMDFFSSGTCQKYLTNLVDWNLCGLYAMESNKDTFDGIKIKSMLGLMNAYKREYVLSSRYCEIENVFSSPEPALWGFTSDGKPLFDKEYRTNDQIARMNEMQRAILDYISSLQVTIDEINQVDPKLFDELYGLFDEKYCAVSVEHFTAGDIKCELTRRFS